MQQPMTLIVRPAESLDLNGRIVRTHSREFYKCDEIAAALSAVAGFDVPILEGSLVDAPAEGFLLTFQDWQIPSFPELGPRIVAMDAGRAEIWSDRIADKYQLAAAIESGLALFGLASVGERAGMELGIGHPSSKYRCLSCPGHCKSRLELLVHYLTVYEELGLHLRPRT